MFLISTRKGLFVAELVDGAYRVTRGHFIGDNVSLAMVDSRPGSGGARATWYAALDHGHFGAKLHRSDDQGGTWTEIATPAYPSQPEGEKEVSPMGREVKWATTLIWSPMIFTRPPGWPPRTTGRPRWASSVGSGSSP